MPCAKSSLISKIPEGALDDQEYIELLDHISTCSECLSTYATIVDGTEHAELFEEIASLVNVVTDGECDALISQLKYLVPGSVQGTVPAPRHISAESVQLNDYRLIRVIAQGGMGVVYEAEQLSLERTVAIKFLSSLAAASDIQIQRFRNEALAVGRLQHPNIVPVHSFSCQDNVHYLVMQYIEGWNLATYIGKLQMNPLSESNRFAATTVSSASEPVLLEYDETDEQDFDLPETYSADEIRMEEHPQQSQQNLLSRERMKEFVRQFIDVVDAIEYAHQRGIVHRDIKPSNVLVDVSGKFWVGDFGVAKTDFSATLTATNLLVGTPRYMSPEQVSGTNGFVDHRTDIYSLGATLYELVTLRPLYQDTTLNKLINRITQEQPSLPRRINPEIPIDLETIILKSISTEKSDRYQTAAELAADLRHFVDGNPITARRPGFIERTSRWLHRHTALALYLLGTIVISLVATIAVIFLLVKHSSEQKELLDFADRSQFKTQQLLYNSRIKEAGLSWKAGDTRQLDATLDELKPSPGEVDFRGDEWFFLKNRVSMEEEHRVSLDAPVYTVTSNADHDLYALAGKDAVIRMFDADSHDALLEFETGQIEVNGLSFSSDGSLLASSGDDGTVCVWSIDYEAAAAALHKQFKAHEGIVFNVLFAKDDQYLITNGNDTAIRFWNFHTGERINELTNHRDRIADLTYCPSRNRIATISVDLRLRLFDLDSFRRLDTLSTGDDRLTSISFSRDGTRLVTTSLDGAIHIRDAEDGHILRELKLLDELRSATFTPDGNAIVAGDRTGMIHFWRLNTFDRSGQQVDKPVSWSGHSDRIYKIAFSHNDESFYSVGHDGNLIEWNYKLRERTRLIQDNKDGKSFGDFVHLQTATGDQLLVCEEKEVQLRDPQTGKLISTLLTLDDTAYRLATSEDCRLFAVADYWGHIYIYDLQKRQVVGNWIVDEDVETKQLELSPDGKLLALLNMGKQENKLYMFNVDTGERLPQYRSSFCDAIAFSPNGDRFYCNGEFNSLQIWNTSSHARFKDFPAHSNTINSIACSADQELFATGGSDRQIKLWTPGSEEPLAIINGHRGRVRSMVFSHDGRRLISCGEDRRINVWNIESGAIDSLLEIDTGRVVPEKISLSRDGHYLTCRLRDEKARETYIRIFEWR